MGLRGPLCLLAWGPAVGGDLHFPWKVGEGSLHHSSQVQRKLPSPDLQPCTPNSLLFCLPGSRLGGARSLGPSEVSFALKYPCPTGAQKPFWMFTGSSLKNLEQTLGLHPSLPRAGQAPSKPSLCSPLARGGGVLLTTARSTEGSGWGKGPPPSLGISHLSGRKAGGSEEGAGELGSPRGALGLTTLALFASLEAPEKGRQSQATQGPGRELCHRGGSLSSCQGTGKGALSCGQLSQMSSRLPPATTAPAAWGTRLELRPREDFSAWREASAGTNWGPLSTCISGSQEASRLPSPTWPCLTAWASPLHSGLIPAGQLESPKCCWAQPPCPQRHLQS